MRNVLVVESDRVERERLAAALEGHGFEVVLCPGPTAPDYTCIGARLGRCPLATHRCVVVLDMDQDGDAAVHGTSAEELLDFYLEGQHPVVTLNSRPTAAEGDRVLRLRRHPETDVLLTAVWWAASPKGDGASGRERRLELSRHDKKRGADIYAVSADGTRFVRLTDGPLTRE